MVGVFLFHVMGKQICSQIPGDLNLHFRKKKESSVIAIQEKKQKAATIGPLPPGSVFTPAILHVKLIKLAQVSLFFQWTAL